MKKRLLFITIIFLFSSCNRKASYEYHLGIVNLTDSELFVKLYPKYNNLNVDYYISTFPFNGTSKKEFTLTSNKSAVLYTTENLIKYPNLLLADIFDSLVIYVDSSLTIKFKPEYFENYSTNMFTDNYNWSFKEFEVINKTNFGNGNTFVDSYYDFEIKQNELKK